MPIIDYNPGRVTRNLYKKIYRYSRSGVSKSYLRDLFGVSYSTLERAIQWGNKHLAEIIKDPEDKYLQKVIEKNEFIAEDLLRDYIAASKNGEKGLKTQLHKQILAADGHLLALKGIIKASDYDAAKNPNELAMVPTAQLLEDLRKNREEKKDDTDAEPESS